MPDYKPKSCVACGTSFKPSSPKQKTCSKECSSTVRRKTEKARTKSKRKVYNKECPFCGKEIKTTDSKRKYCGSEECEQKRLFKNHKKADQRRKGSRSGYKKHYFANNKGTILEQKKKYYRETLFPDRDVKDGWSTSQPSFEEVKNTFESEGYKLLEDSYDNNRTKMSVVCPKGHNWTTTYHNFKDDLNRCKTCYFDSLGSSKEEVLSFISSIDYRWADSPSFDRVTHRDSIQLTCDKGHNITMTYGSLVGGTRCSVCFHEGLKHSKSKVFSEIEKEGITVLSTKYESNKSPLKCKCNKGHNFSISYTNFLGGSRCPECFYEKCRTPFKFIQQFFESQDYTLHTTTYKNQAQKLEYTCSNGHKGSVAWRDFYHKQNRCRTCYLESSSSRAELELLDFVRGLVGEENAVHCDRNAISPYELDIFCPEKKVAVEYCGLYWHSEISGQKVNRYHYDKMMACYNKGIRLLTVFEDEYKSKPEVVKSRIQNALGMSAKRVYARKCRFGVVMPKVFDRFLEDYHLQGKSTCSWRFGLFYEEELVAVASFGYLSRTHTATVNGKTMCELKRFASKPGYSIIGGASKLIKNAIPIMKQHRFEGIKSYCDMRYANIAKPVYETVGFDLLTWTKWTPHYVKDGKRYRNQGLRKTAEERLTGKTEWQLRKEQGYDRLWDCGHRTYVLFFEEPSDV